MRINEDEFNRAGKLSQNFSWTDEELKLITTATRLTLAFLSGKGQEWHLATVPLLHNLNQFEGFMAARKRNGGNHE